jgi:phage shock protein PspC (stress-responsive transcriptional regulator)
MEKRLYRSRSERVIAGVCGGLAEYFEIDPTLVRAAVVLLGLVTQGGILIAYLIMAVVVPEEPASEGAVAPATPAAAAVPHVVTPPHTEEGFTMTENDTSEAVPAPEQAPAPPAPVAPTPPQYVAPVAPVAPKPVAPRPHASRGLWWGLALIVVGLLLLADQFLPGVSLWQYWPLIIVAIGLATVIKGVRR